MRDNRKDENYTPDMPPTNAGGYLVAYLFEVGPTMASGMGMGPVTHQEIAAWQSLTGIPLTPWDARAIRRLSIEYSNWSIKAGLKLNANVICEKPLALTLESLQHLQEAETYTDKHIYTILQLRLHPMLLDLKKEIAQSEISKQEVLMEYHTPRGKWYSKSWKGDIKKSGGVATNIGIHLFDLAVWLFGEVQYIQPEILTDTESKGILELQGATVKWDLSIEPTNTPKRQIIINGKSYEFTDGFSDLHTVSYEAILNNKGFGLDVIQPSIEIVERIRAFKEV